ncbi:alpha/beta fold hydrolase [Sphingomonas sp. CGMCC 1.13654]|uniref:Alpha/beta fold hydrolase n=1 Tax=Sphingomonas chungangi TaxID=2683589 RepID=A0A838L7Y1_9SPHN|nr:alpha/beta fold hydrolase [Sphingomonas chungangi]MBA2934822.1 alpha/beta fold hydrolase [Sphingomonas chungangi]MVW58133.1 alpha/beta fold hydrolase [Sphingomonas chungangi]
MAASVRRRFVKVGARNVHYRMTGTGPAALFIHSSPANSSFVLPEMAAMADRFTCIAFDTPGFGLSDPLPGDRLEVADLADAIAEAMQALAMPPCPVFGTHTGAAIALELAVRHPALVTGLVLDAVPIFTEAETAALFEDYLIALDPDPLGGHFSRYWTRFRDQSIWFPWSQPSPAHLNPYDLAAPERTDHWVSMFYECGRSYAPAYRAALDYGPRAIAAVQALEVPALFTAIASDMLFPHLDRLPPLRQGQSVVRLDASLAAKHALLREAFAGYAASTWPDIVRGGPPDRQFVDVAGGQIFARLSGDGPGTPLVIVPDLPGPQVPRIEGIEARPVVTLDPPGSGESCWIDGGLEDIALLLWQAIGSLGYDRVILHGTGFGAVIAAAMAGQRPDRTETLILCGPPWHDENERRAFADRIAPPIEIEADGSHWYRAWLMLRDSLVWFPWYDRRQTAQRRVPADFDAWRLHERTVRVMKQRQDYARPIMAALSVPLGALLDRVTSPIFAYGDDEVPFSTASDQQWREWRQAIRWIETGGLNAVLNRP